MIIKNSNNNNRNKNNINSNMIRKTKQRKCQKRQTATSATNKQGESNANRTHDLVVWGAAPAMEKTHRKQSSAVTKPEITSIFPAIERCKLPNIKAPANSMEIRDSRSKLLQQYWQRQIQAPKLFFLLLGFFRFMAALRFHCGLLDCCIHWDFLASWPLPQKYPLQRSSTT